MIRQKPHLTLSLLAAMILVAAATHADSAEPDRVLMTKQPLSTEQAKAVQKAWADHLGVDAVIENSIGMELSVIPPGTFRMGWEERKGEEGPRVVTHSQPYFIGRHEVTQGEFERVMGKLRWKPGRGAGERFPMYTVNYVEAAEFCRKLTVLEREAGKLPKGYEYRLPTDAELEYAGRAGTVTVTFFGDKVNSTQANFDGREPDRGAEVGPNLGRTAEVGSYPANAWGLHGTIGNLYEWCIDWYHPLVKGGADPVQLLPDPKSLIPQRVRRGGCHSRAGRYCRSANRFYYHPENRSSLNGFRVVLSKLHHDGFQQVTDGTQTVYTQTWTRDGTNTRIWHKRDSKTRNYFVMSGHIHSLPGISYAVPLTDKSHNTWAHACLTDGRILVQGNPPNQEPGYFLMTPGKDRTPEFERIQCDLATKGVLERIRLSPSETRLCFEFQTGFEDDVPGRTLYIADFDAKQPAITNARPFANEDGKPVRFAWPRWSKDESAIVYQADGKLYSYNLADKSTTVAQAGFKTSVSPNLETRSVSERSKSKAVPPNPSLARRVTNGSGTSSNETTTKVATNNSDDSTEPERVLMTENPLSAEQAKAAQKTWADHIGFEVAFENSIGMQLRVIPPGTFRMNSRRTAAGQKGPVDVTLSQAFLIGQLEVTQAEWERVMGLTETKLDAGAGDRFPMYRVNHAEARDFCRKLNQLEREAGKLPDGYEYRLPTAAEWVFACRAGTLTRYYTGESMNSRLANYDGTQPYKDTEKGPLLGRTAEVGSYPANAWGLHDMLGNVTEWCLDWYHHEVEGGADPVQLKRSPIKIPGRVIRGGAWSSPGKYCHSANRWYFKPESRASIGFRPVLTKIRLVATGQANSTQVDTTPGANLVAAATRADDSDEPKPVLMTEHALTTGQAQAVQKAWAEHLGVDAAFNNSIGMQLRVIPPGTYLMGSPRGEVNRKSHETQVEVTLSKAFLIGRYEVTQGEWERVMGPRRRQLKHGVGDRFPVYEINHAEASEFCRKLTQLDRDAGTLPDGYQYRLPTDAEWEYACRAGTLTATYFGDKMSSKQANNDGENHPYNGAEKGPNLDGTAEVGSYPANAWGLHDMHGNLCEWCVDWHELKVKGGVDPVQLDPKLKRVIRDCRFRNPGMYARSANRYYAPPEQRRSTVGFRPVLSKLQHGQ